jgi:iron complex outermembrane receptor protein
LDKSYVKARLYYDKYQNSLYAYDDATYSTMKKKSSFMSDYDDHTYGGSVELGTSLVPRNLIKLAGFYKDDVHKEHNVPNPYQTFEDRIFSIGAEDTITITSRLYAILGLSYDSLETVQAQNYNTTTKQFSDFPMNSTNAWNPQGGLFYSLTDTARINFSISQKTRFPTIKDKYSFRLGAAIPNPDLKPEQALNYELGYQDALFKRIALKTAVFYREIRDYILQVTVPDPSNPGKTTLQNQNVGHVDQFGFEIEFNASVITTLDVGINYTYLSQDNRSTSDKLINVPDHKFFAYAKYSPIINALSFLIDLEMDSQRYSSTNGVQIAGSYTLVNAKVMYQVVKGLTAEAGVRNVFDQNYALQEGFPMPGRTYFGNLLFRF